MKAFNKIALLVVAMIAFTGLVNAYDIGIVKEIQINNNAMYKAPSLTGGAEVNVNSMEVERGSLLTIDVRLEAPATEDVKNAEVADDVQEVALI